MQACSACIIGPTLLDLQEIYETSMESISLCLVLMGLGNLVGSLCSKWYTTCLVGKFLMKSVGRAWTRFHDHKHLLTCFVMAMVSLNVALVPHVRHLWGFGAIVIFLGIFNSCFNVSKLAAAVQPNTIMSLQ